MKDKHLVWITACLREREQFRSFKLLIQHGFKIIQMNQMNNKEGYNLSILNKVNFRMKNLVRVILMKSTNRQFLKIINNLSRLRSCRLQLKAKIPNCILLYLNPKKFTLWRFKNSLKTKLSARILVLKLNIRLSKIGWNYHLQNCLITSQPFFQNLRVNFRSWLRSK